MHYYEFIISYRCFKVMRSYIYLYTDNNALLIDWFDAKYKHPIFYFNNIQSSKEKRLSSKWSYTCFYNPPLISTGSLSKLFTTICATRKFDWWGADIGLTWKDFHVEGEVLVWFWGATILSSKFCGNGLTENFSLRCKEGKFCLR